MVTGENLAFAMALAGPLLRRLGPRPRFVATVGVVVWFALLTRFEPSVLRAGAMAAIAATAVVLARPASTMRILALAVAGLVVIDPLLVWSVGWWLSVGATAGIALLGAPLAARLPGPRVLREAIAVTVAAQVGVAPVLVAVFGGLPVVAVPANVLAVPVAGPVMVWGLPAGVIAGLAPALAPGLHLPTRLGVRWIALVARTGAAAPLGELRMAQLVVVAIAAGVVMAGCRLGRPRSRGRLIVLGGAIVAGVAVSVVPIGGPAALAGAAVGRSARVWRSGSSTVLVVDGSDSQLLGGLRELDIGHVDAVIATARLPDLADSLAPVLRRYQPSLVLAPAGSPLPAATPAAPGVTAVGDFDIVVGLAGDRLDVDVVQAEADRR